MGGTDFQMRGEEIWPVHSFWKLFQGKQFFQCKNLSLKLQAHRLFLDSVAMTFLNTDPSGSVSTFNQIYVKFCLQNITYRCTCMINSYLPPECYSFIGQLKIIQIHVLREKSFSFLIFFFFLSHRGLGF